MLKILLIFIFITVYSSANQNPSARISHCSGRDEFFVADANRCLKLIREENVMGLKALDVCEKAGGSIVHTNDEESRYSLMKAVEAKCEHNNCPHVCVIDDYPDSIGLEQSPWYLKLLNRPINPVPYLYEPKRTAITAPMHMGDAIYIDIKFCDQSLDVFELVDSIVEDMREESQVSLIFQLGIYHNFTDVNGDHRNEIVIRTGYMTRKNNNLNVDNLVKHTLPLDPLENSTIYTIKIHITEGRTVISSPGLLEKAWSFETPEVSGRMYLSRDRFGEPNDLIDVYIMKRGHCRKSMYLENYENNVINCHWTTSTQSIPSYYCDRAQFVACHFATNVTFADTIYENEGNAFLNALFKSLPGFVLCFTTIGTICMSGSLLHKFSGR